MLGDRADDLGRAAPFHERDDEDLAAPRLHLAATDDLFRRVVATLGDHIGSQRAHDLERRIVAEHHDGVDDA